MGNSFSSRYCNYFLEYSQAFILLTVLCIFLTLKFAAIQFGQRTFFQCIWEHQSPWNKLIIKAAISRAELFIMKWEIFTERFSTECLIVWSSYFLLLSILVTILFLVSYFLKINTFSAQLLSRRNIFSRIRNYSEYVLFPCGVYFEQRLFQKKNLFRSRYFLKKSLFYDSSA